MVVWAEVRPADIVAKRPDVGRGVRASVIVREPWPYRHPSCVALRASDSAPLTERYKGGVLEVQHKKHSTHV